MFKTKEWEFTGTSGKKYTFELFPKSGALPETAGIFILAYTHPRGHLAGFQVNTLSMGESDNVQEAVTNHGSPECLFEGCWNSNFVLRLDDTRKRTEYLTDLLNNYPTLC